VCCVEAAQHQRPLDRPIQGSGVDDVGEVEQRPGGRGDPEAAALCDVVC
jgi:hypothetical protein